MVGPYRMCLDCEQCGMKSERTLLFGDRHVRSGQHEKEYIDEGEKIT
jgi:hypothetical protein